MKRPGGTELRNNVNASCYRPRGTIIDTEFSVSAQFSLARRLCGFSGTLRRENDAATDHVFFMDGESGEGI
jgi:hypothetical protein